MGNIWIIVANSSNAYLYSMSIKNEKFQCDFIEEFTHPQSRKKDIDLTSDRAGRYYTKGSTTSRSAYSPPTEPKEHEAEIFAKQLASVLESARLANLYENLIVVAPPHFHGLLNKNCNKNVFSLISKHIEKDYTKLGTKGLHKRLGNHLYNSK